MGGELPLLPFGNPIGPSTLLRMVSLPFEGLMVRVPHHDPELVDGSKGQGSTSSPHFEVPRGRSRGREPALREPQGLELVETVETVEPVPGPGSCVPTPDFCQGRFLRGTHVGSGLSLVRLSLK